MKTMTFSHQVKDELAHHRAGRPCCRAAELSAVIRVDGGLLFKGKGRFGLRLSSENAAVTRKSLRLFSNLYHLTGDVSVRRSKLSGANNYFFELDDRPGLEQALNELGILDDSLNPRPDVPGRLVKSNCCAAAYARGLFLGGGFISNPQGQYHLEVVTRNPAVAETCKDLLSRFDITARVIEKDDRYTLYLKQAQAIVDFLALIGAFSAILAWEDVRTVKDVRASVNRRVNCDTANLNKVVKASVDQVNDIVKIDEAMGLSKLPKGVREIAVARVANPHSNLAELGEACSPKLSKSAVYHRIRRLKEYADKLTGTP